MERKLDVSKTGKSIAYLRKRKGLTQKQLADVLGISDKAVSKWERGLSCPDVSLVNQLAVVLDSDVGSMLEGKVGHKESTWKGILYLDSSLSPDVKIGNETLLSIQLCYFTLARIKEIAIICDDTVCVQKIINRIKEINIQIYSSNSSYQQKLNVFIGKSDVMLIYKPLFLYGVNITQKFLWAMAKPDGVTALAVYDPKGANKPIFFDSEQKVTIQEASEGITRLTDYSFVPMLFCKSKVFLQQKCNLTEVPVKYIEPIRRGTIKILLEKLDDVNDVEMFVDMMYRRMGIEIYRLKSMLNK